MKVKRIVAKVFTQEGSAAERFCPPGRSRKESRSKRRALRPSPAGQRIGAVLTGGNVAPEQMAVALRRVARSGVIGSRPKEIEMAAAVLYMSMSLDGYIAGSNDEPGNPGGDGFGRLHEWGATAEGTESLRPSGAAGELFDEMYATGAVLAGRRTAEQVDHWKGDHHGVPIFVLSHRSPAPAAANYPSVTYVTDGIASAMAKAKAAAGDRNVMVHGAYTAQRALEAGVLDELQIHQIPVLFGRGRRLFDMLPSRVELEIVRVVDTPKATHLRYRVRRAVPSQGHQANAK